MTENQIRRFILEIVAATYILHGFCFLDKIILEIKCVKSSTDEHMAQTINYLKVKGYQLGLQIKLGEVGLNTKD